MIKARSPLENGLEIDEDDYEKESRNIEQSEEQEVGREETLEEVE